MARYLIIDTYAQDAQSDTKMEPVFNSNGETVGFCLSPEETVAVFEMIYTEGRNRSEYRADNWKELKKTL